LIVGVLPLVDVAAIARREAGVNSRIDVIRTDRTAALIYSNANSVCSWFSNCNSKLMSSVPEIHCKQSYG
jgi:hypothetical protein